MKVVHIESGIGNQMLSYCELLALQHANPEEVCYIENIIYDIPECNDVICQWNGYELERVFGIHASNVKELFDDATWQSVKQDIADSRFWDRNWNYPVYFTDAFRKHGLALTNIRGDFEGENATLMTKESSSFKSRLRKTYPGHLLKRVLNRVNRNKILRRHMEAEQLFLSTDEDLYTGQRLSFKFKGNHISRIESKIREVFTFPALADETNIRAMEEITENNSVAIHARRGDMLGYNYDCYQFGYFKRAVRYMKKHVENPLFIFFCDPGSVDWCKENLAIFGLKAGKDRIRFVDWNAGEQSYIDMQLMAKCKHQIITRSSFGWWGAFLNENPLKITCSPDFEINTTHHF